jgi:hypothetical protein
LDVRDKAGRVRVDRECYSLGCWKGQTEETLGVGRGCITKIVWILAANNGDPFERVRDPRRLVALAAIRHRRQVRRIGFDQQAIARHHPNEIVVSPLLEGHDSAERHVPTASDREFGQRLRSRVAVQHSNDSGAVRVSDDRARVVLRIAGVNHHRSPRLPGELNLRLEGRALRRARRVVVVVVETAFPHRDRTTLEKAAKAGYVSVGAEGRGVVGMNARRREDEARVLRGVVCRLPGGIERLTDANDRGRARVPGAGDYRVAVAGERFVREVGVAVDEACRAPVLRGHLRSIQRRTGAAT